MGVHVGHSVELVSSEDADEGSLELASSDNVETDDSVELVSSDDVERDDSVELVSSEDATDDSVELVCSEAGGTTLDTGSNEVR